MCVVTVSYKLSSDVHMVSYSFLNTLSRGKLSADLHVCTNLHECSYSFLYKLRRGKFVLFQFLHKLRRVTCVYIVTVSYKPYGEVHVCNYSFLHTISRGTCVLLKFLTHTQQTFVMG